MTDTIKLAVEVPNDKKSVILEARYEAGGDADVRHYLLAPHHAVEIANSLLHAAEICGIEVQVQTYHHISDMQRLQLIARVGHIMRTYSKKHGNVAMQIVDSVLNEVL